ncbi:hypothetical protein [Paenibacillus sp. N3.4]|uniref:hypothetical protein n=1 Tax=Paenibacillus sp. N3.4 TaxID=2603222 RepID=UPI0011CA811D|nr:hypothetical protein [Paenibacillus sp. N3.4]TXK85071.1 hypothetical protein FU659_06140 [Paenibacillus sp. N3.4]
MGIKLKNNYFRYALLIVWIHACVLAILIIVDVAKHSSFLKQDAYFESLAFDNEIQLHFNLIRYFHMDNKHYPLLTEDAKLVWIVVKIGNYFIETWRKIAKTPLSNRTVRDLQKRRGLVS